MSTTVHNMTLVIPALEHIGRSIKSSKSSSLYRKFEIRLSYKWPYLKYTHTYIIHSNQLHILSYSYNHRNKIFNMQYVSQKHDGHFCCCYCLKNYQKHIFALIKIYFYGLLYTSIYFYGLVGELPTAQHEDLGSH